MHRDIWAAVRPAELAWRDWDDLGVVYDGGSGDTHLISALGIEMLALIVATPRSEADIAAELTAAMPDDLPPETVRQLIADQLQQLQAFGLIAPSDTAR